MSSLTAKLYEEDGSLVRTLKTKRIEVSVGRGRAIRRTASLDVAASEDDLWQIGRMVKVYKGADPLFVGYLDAEQDNNRPGAKRVRVTCRDKAKRLAAVRWGDEKTYEDTTASEGSNLIASVSASTSLSAGGEIQSQGRVYKKEHKATILGVEQDITPASESGDPLAGTYSVDYSAAGMTQLKAVVYIDLKAIEDLQSVTVTTNGAATVEKSSDGQTWGAWAAGTARYLRVTVTKSVGPITIGVVVTTASSYPASNTTDGDKATGWRPTTSDLDRWIKGNTTGAQTANRLILELGVSESDPFSRYKIKVERSSDNGSTWTEIATIASAGRLTEVVFSDVSLTDVRVTFLARSAPVAVRHMSLTRVTVDAGKKVYLHDIIQDIAAGEGETLFRLTSTRQYIPAVTFQRGRTKWESILQLAEDHGWEAFYDREGYLVAQPVDIDPWPGIGGSLTKLSAVRDADRTKTDAEIYNEILATNGNPTNPLRSTKSNADAWNEAGTANTFKRTSPELTFPLADTQAKLDYAALVELEKRMRPTYKARVSHGAAAAPIDLEAGDVVLTKDSKDETPHEYILESFAITDTGKDYSMSMEVQAL